MRGIAAVLLAHRHRRRLVLLALFFAPAVASAAPSTLTLNGSTSGTATVQVPAVAGSTTFQLPGTNGTNAFCLETDGTGVTSWASCGSAVNVGFSSLIGATATDSFTNANFAQTWAWGTLSTETGLKLTTSSMTTGTLLSLSNTSTPANPGTVLNVSNSQAGGAYGIQSSVASTTSGTAIYGAETGASNSGYAGYFNNTSTSGWSIYAPGAAPSYFAGSVGIGSGNTAPWVELDLDSGGTSTADTLLIGNNTTKGLALSDTSSAGGVDIYSIGVPLLINNSGAQNTFFNANGTAAGLVGIGTTSTTVPLYVKTTAASAVVMTLQNGSGTCTHKPGASSETVSCSSDARLKMDIRDAGSVLAGLRDLRIRDFTVKASGEKTTGVIAQEMIEAHPEMVHMGTDGFYTVEKPNPWRLLRIIQEQQTEISTLRAVNNEVQHELNVLKARAAR